MAKKNIREEILNAARRLFNEHGYNDVSMRDVAAALGISVGNLTYHFARKEDLIEAVVEEMFRYYEPLPTPKTLPELNARFARMQNNIQQNAFYFWHYTQLSQMSESVHEKQTGMLQQQYRMFSDGFAALHAAGMMKPECHEGHFNQLAQAILLICVYWVPQSYLEQGLDTPKDFLDCVWGVLLPQLTEEGAAVYRDKIVKVRMAFDPPEQAQPYTAG